MKRGNPLPRGTKGLARTAGLRPAARRRTPARGTGLPRAAVSLVLARDGYACCCCGTPIIGRPHSVRRRSRSAGDSPANLLTFLGDGSRFEDPGDHSARVDSRCDPTDAARGFTVPWGQDPELVPVMLSVQAGRVMVWLAADGSYRTEPPAAQGTGATA